MIEKVLILELKEAYALAMEEGGSVVRIKRKSGLSVGDEIYILPEDLYEQTENAILVPIANAQTKKNRTKRQKIWTNVLKVAAVFVLLITV
ncbi:hypothetical protein EVA_10632, partial [gut metagenome]